MQSITKSHRLATISTGMWLSTAQQMVQGQVCKASLTTCSGWVREHSDSLLLHAVFGWNVCIWRWYLKLDLLRVQRNHYCQGEKPTFHFVLPLDGRTQILNLYFCFYFRLILSFFFRQDLMYLWLASNWQYSQSWPWTFHPPASTSLALRLSVCTTTPSLQGTGEGTQCLEYLGKNSISWATFTAFPALNNQYVLLLQKRL